MDYSFGGKLSAKGVPPVYAYCDTCKRVYVDDTELPGRITCPNHNDLPLNDRPILVRDVSAVNARRLLAQREQFLIPLDKRDKSITQV